MTAFALAPTRYKRVTDTSATSRPDDIFQELSFWNRVIGGTRNHGETISLDERLADASAKARKVVRDSVRDLGEEQVGNILKRLRAVLDPDNWDERDPVPSLASLRTIIRTIIALESDAGDLTVTHGGTWVISWSRPGVALRVEGLADGRVNWSILREEGAVRADQGLMDSISSLRVAVAA